MFHFNLVRRIGIDLGTANSLVFIPGEGIVLNEPTVVAITHDDNKVVAVGNEAKEMLGRTPENIIASRPMRDGVIADYMIIESMLRYFINKVMGKVKITKPEVMICAPAGVTSVERRAVLDATLSAGAKTAYLIDECLAAAIGARMPIGDPSGNFIADIGGGTTEVAIISLGGIVVNNTVRVGGNKLDEAIASSIRRKYNLIVGYQMSEKIKIEIGSATHMTKEKKMEIKGRDSVNGLPKSITITSSEVTEALALPLKSIVGAIKTVLENTPPELASDIIDNGLVMTGGTSLLRNIDQLLTRETGVPCLVADDPLNCVAVGTGIALENLDHYKRNITRKG
ncbi:rod shape-determining protein [candidate division CPR3 bacterium GWF2_35_18]|uniref:Cell shape-determining protein MreB n=1 Tax=candidate division CPR3 bacterium GW2011_GWF2_35_18 TaxID=1618350 RepID=A0A0G0BJ33_UNCC3|nr:MAG: Rod shape-determining protein mreB [candidate division CPR3 bacterium GW2011_GWF2_35_18]KKP86783.1 MAG: Rod shape-determining protein mreB [candidate division CPR3 bacterium GW2011_GWE2_35_7]OGB62927.1 MAG: rod shape-determining protein [candidate division CPR3 bacterium GWF2_35_18]OGB65947.1 MAG: rod shape-determining protein [candidate division CPR3 bacterium RIFOXYA2_FULL_35_13]OGB76825.1 MAG: rod shape-determining protein [candidate division CPR3 bacterium RIFOXYC2_FULL_35_7]OGB786